MVIAKGSIPMGGFRFDVVWAVVLGVTVGVACGEARAQSGGFSLGSPSVPVSGGQAAPASFPIFSPLQAMGASPVGMGGMGGQTNMFNNPWASPMLYGGMMGMSPNLSSSSASATGSTASTTGATAGTTASLVNPMGLSSNQMGMMMLMSTPQMMGMGSGQRSGVPPGAGSAQGTVSQLGGVRVRGSAAQPGGLAASYFNRTTKISRSPQSYFNRQTRYFPQSGR